MAYTYSLITVTYAFIRVLNFCGWSQLRNFFHGKIFLIYGTSIVQPLLGNTQFCKTSTKQNTPYSGI